MAPREAQLLLRNDKPKKSCADKWRIKAFAASAMLMTVGSQVDPSWVVVF